MSSSEIVTEFKRMASFNRDLALCLRFQTIQYSKFILKEDFISDEDYEEIRQELKQRFPNIDVKDRNFIVTDDVEEGGCSLTVELDKDKWKLGEHFFLNVPTLLEDTKERVAIAGSFDRW